MFILPATKCSVSDFDNDVAGLFDLWDRPLLDGNLKRSLKDDCLHSVLTHDGGWFRCQFYSALS